MIKDEYQLLQTTFDGLDCNNEQHLAWVGGMRDRFGGFNSMYKGQSHLKWLFDYYTNLSPKEQAEFVKKWTRSKNGSKKEELKKLTVDLSLSVHRKLERQAQKEGFSKQNLVKHLVNVYVKHPEVLRYGERVRVGDEILSAISSQNEQLFSATLRAEFDTMKSWMSEKGFLFNQSISTEHDIETLCKMLDTQLLYVMRGEGRLDEAAQDQVANLGAKIRHFQAGVDDV
ncbi:hypothetical protein MD535_16400 [Vibrio sp. ZSDZ65]|uniref:Uncharacterized protein n=1 Tax=Vibrio qingdaonensis TaxID=2829491 RepID=A0A9X3CQ84_9VIBR|nr:hypothetical protein [Vibrio qingdaonensis]MCW8347583.1 hypothetical protein [Vibrio qingdaonensis]